MYPAWFFFFTRICVSTISTDTTLTDACKGNLLGPFGPLSYTPSILAPYLSHIGAINTTPLLTPKERELVVLATTSITKAAYIEYAHKKIGLTAGLSREQVDAAASGLPVSSVPELIEREQIAYELGLELAKRSGKVDDVLFEEAMGVGKGSLGREGVSAVAQVVGAYLLAAVLVNVAGVGVPEE